jgi:adenylate cyclase class 2
LEHREIEIKLRMDTPRARVAARLRSLGATLRRPRHFEDNYIVDDRKGSIARSGSLLRVRLAPPAATLTYKGPRRIVRGAKSRAEMETEISDGNALLKALERIGFRCTFRYQKYRTLYRCGSVLIALDETPIGNYIEVEGSPAGIERISRKLGFARGDFITGTYYELFHLYGRANHIRSKHMVFGIEASRKD